MPGQVPSHLLPQWNAIIYYHNEMLQALLKIAQNCWCCFLRSTTFNNDFTQILLFCYHKEIESTFSSAETLQRQHTKCLRMKVRSNFREISVWEHFWVFYTATVRWSVFISHFNVVFNLSVRGMKALYYRYRGCIAHSLLLYCFMPLWKKASAKSRWFHTPEDKIIMFSYTGVVVHWYSGTNFHLSEVVRTWTKHAVNKMGKK